MLLAHKIALDPNNAQATHFAKATGTARFAYNWALTEWNRQYEAWKADNSLPKPSEGALRRQLNAIKREQFPWMLDVTKCAPAKAIMDLGEAFKNFFSGRAEYPKFHKKGRCRDRFYLNNNCFKIEGSSIRLPKIGWVRMHEPLRFDGKIMGATISRVAHRWFISITVETQDAPPCSAENQGVVGVDLGITTLAMLSTGEAIAGPKAHTRLLGRLRRLSRSFSRKQKGSANSRKAGAKLARLHARIANIRQDATHKLTSNLTRRFHTIGIEDLNVAGMMKNRHLARPVVDMAFGEFRWQLDYKAERRGGLVVVANRWYPSSKTCSACGLVQTKMPLSVRQWICPGCGTRHDRDLNAARNLATYAASSAVSACGEEGAGRGRKTPVKPASAKQEVSFTTA